MTMKSLNSNLYENLIDLADATQAERGEIFRSYIVAGSNPSALEIINTIEKAFRFNLKLEVCGDKSDQLERVLKLLGCLDISYATVQISPQNLRNPMRWLRESSDNCLRILVSSSDEGMFDIGTLVAYYLEVHLEKLRKSVPNYPTPQVDIIFLAQLEALRRKQKKFDISAYVLQNLLSCEEGTPLSFFENNVGAQLELQLLYNTIQELDEIGQHYLGFSSSETFLLNNQGQLGFAQRLFNAIRENELRKHCTALAVAQPSNNLLFKTKTHFPHYVKSYSFNLYDVEEVGKNLSAFPSLKDEFNLEKKKKMLRCLTLRLGGINEMEIGKKLNFKDYTEYLEWVQNHFISIESLCRVSAFDRWKWAMHIVENFALIGKQNAKIEVLKPNLSESIEVAAQPTKRQILFGPDFRSINMDGKEFVATPKQASVLSYMFDQRKLGTRTLGVSTVLMEVYSKSKEKNLRKLFDKNELYDLLIEEGTSKGTVRLKDCFDYIVTVRQKAEEL